jgi:hypothetical protein
LYESPEVYSALKRMFEGYDRNGRPSLDREWYLSQHLALAWRGGQWDDAGALLDKLNGKPITGSFNAVRGWKEGAVSQIHAMRSAEGAAIERAERALKEQRNYDAAIAAYAQAVAALPQGHLGLMFARHRWRGLQLERDFHAGKEVSLMPAADLAPWHGGGGDWRLDDEGRLVATSVPPGSSHQLCFAEFGQEYELSAKVDWPGPIEKAGMAVFYVHVARQLHPYVSLAPDGQLNVVTPNHWKGGRGELRPVNEVVIRVRGGTVSAALNGKSIVKDYPVDKVPTRYTYVGLRVWGPQRGKTVRFQDVRIRRLENREK